MVHKKKKRKIKNRPKFWVGSGGPVWTYEFMQMRRTESLIFTAEQNDNLEYIKLALNKSHIKLMETL